MAVTPCAVSDAVRVFSEFEKKLTIWAYCELLGDNRSAPGRTERISDWMAEESWAGAC